jgi:hypothetical protein
MKILMVLTSHDQLGDTGQNPASSTGTAQALNSLLSVQKAA